MTNLAWRIAGAIAAAVMLGTTAVLAVTAAGASGAQPGNPDLPPP